MNGRLAGLGQFEDFIIPEWDAPVYDFALPDFSTDVFYDYPADYSYDFAMPEYDFGVPDLGVDFATDTIGYDVYDPLAGDLFYSGNYSYDWSLPSEYGDAFPVDADTSGIDYASGVVVDYSTPEAWADYEWSSYETATAQEVAQQYPDATSAAGWFSFEFPDVDWNALLKAGMDIYKLYASMQQPQAAKRSSPYGTPSVMRDPRTGQTVPAVRDPRTGQLVPAVRDTRTGMLVPATTGAAGLIPGVPNWALFAGVGALAFVLLTQPRRAPRRRRR